MWTKTKKNYIKIQIHSITKTHMNVNFSCNQLHRKKTKLQTKYITLDKQNDVKGNERKKKTK